MEISLQGEWACNFWAMAVTGFVWSYADMGTEEQHLSRKTQSYGSKMSLTEVDDSEGSLKTRQEENHKPFVIGRKTL